MKRTKRLLCILLAMTIALGATAAYAVEDDGTEGEPEAQTQDTTQEPSSDNNEVVTPEPETEQDTEQDNEPEPDTGSETDPDTEPGAETDPEPGNETDPEPGEDPGTDPGTEPGTEPGDEPDPTEDPDPDPGVEELVLSGDLTLKVGETSAITANQEASWSTSDSGVVEISGGTGVSCSVTAVSEGVATITATTEDGQTASCAVAVEGDADDGDDGNDGNNNNNYNNYNRYTTPTSTYGNSLSQVSRVGLLPTLVQKYTMPNHVPKNVAMTFSCSLNKRTDQILDLMYTYDCYGTFFVDSDDIYKQDDRIRRIVGEGHSLGIELDQKDIATAAGALETVEQANRDLATVCGVPTRLVTIKGGSEETLSKSVYLALSRNGYRVWDWDYYVNEKSYSVEKAAKRLQKKLDTKKRIVVRFETNKKSVATLQETLGFILYAQIPTQALADSDKPVCNMAD